MAGKSPPQFKILNDTRDIVTLMTSFFACTSLKNVVFLFNVFQGKTLKYNEIEYC